MKKLAKRNQITNSFIRKKFRLVTESFQNFYPWIAKTVQSLELYDEKYLQLRICSIFNVR